METIAKLASWFQATNVSAIVRIHKSFAHLIPGILDQGIMGIQVSEVENRRGGARHRPPGEVSADRQPGHLRPGAAHRIQELRTAPRHRIRAMGQREHHHIPSIESLEGLENVEKIAAVEGIDMIAYGHSDLSAQLGVHLDLEHPKFKAAGASDRGGMQCPRQTRSGIGGGPRRRSRNIGSSDARC